MATSLDLQKVKALPVQKTLLLINNFIVNTTKFLNMFSETCEKRISSVSSKVTELEILLAVLEAKLNSIPGLEFTENLQSEATAPGLTASPVPVLSSPAPDSSSQSQSTEPPAAMEAPAPVIPVNGTLCKDHPAYEPFFKMLRVGVPPPVVHMKVLAAGLNPAMLDTPDAVIVD